MFPTLFTIGPITISTFGVFLILSLLVAAYVIWRMIKVYEIDEEKTIDFIFLSFIGSLISARAYFVLSNLSHFDSFYKVLLFGKYPGMSFWGGVIGGIVILKLASIRLKINFWQIADFAVVGLFVGLSISSIGCLLGGCQYGQVSDLPIAVSQVGQVGSRFPLQIIESGLFLTGFLLLWKAVMRFHFAGKITTKGLIIFGSIKLILEFFRGDTQLVSMGITMGHIFSVLFISLGTFFYYNLARRSVLSDIRMLWRIIFERNKRKQSVLKLQRSWYNLRVNWKFKVLKFKRKVSKNFNVKSNPTKFR